ncbi:hypothetical protein BUE80_DR003320 [Diplocarpon rosae]|nr:hypothetical protein BUE80_DR003320 [Diplocarpon rosae]
MSTTSLPISPLSPPTLPSSRFHCLQVRLLYEKCGHIETLTIHELPCAKLYRGWLPESSPYIQSKACHGLSRHLALKHSGCGSCLGAAAVPKRGLLGWGRSQKRDANAALPIQEICLRRLEWIKVMEAQAERQRRRGGERV